MKNRGDCKRVSGEVGVTRRIFPGDRSTGTSDVSSRVRMGTELATVEATVEVTGNSHKPFPWSERDNR